MQPKFSFMAAPEVEELPKKTLKFSKKVADYLSANGIKTNLEGDESPYGTYRLEIHYGAKKAVISVVDYIGEEIIGAEND